MDSMAVVCHFWFYERLRRSTPRYRSESKGTIRWRQVQSLSEQWYPWLCLLRWFEQRKLKRRRLNEVLQQDRERDLLPVGVVHATMKFVTLTIKHRDSLIATQTHDVESVMDIAFGNSNSGP
jgi:hypothetical protein